MRLLSFKSNKRKKEKLSTIQIVLGLTYSGSANASLLEKNILSFPSLPSVLEFY